MEAWFGWFKSFVIEGKCTDGDELSGSITLLAPDLQEELLTLELDHVGIVGLSESPADDSKQIALFDAELYVEEIRLG